jgi:hypothetical protein
MNGLTSQQRAYLALVVAGAATAVAATVAPGIPSGADLLLFAAMAVIAVTVGVVVTRGMFLSPLMMLVIAAIYVSGQHGSYPAGALVALAGGLRLPHLRARRFDRITFNSAQLFLASLAASGVFAMVDPGQSDTAARLVLAAAGGSLAYTVVNVGVTAPMIAMSDGISLAQVLGQLRPIYLQTLPFAVMGGALGWLYLGLGPVVLPLVLAPILVVRQALQSSVDLEAVHESTLEIFGRALATKDPYTAGHAERVAVYSVRIGAELGFSRPRLARLRCGALVHDVGKLIVPNGLLNKPGRLTLEEYVVVKSHEDASVAILDEIDFLRPVAPAASGDFSHYNARPDDERVPIEPFIVAVADAYDAMTSTRAYRRALPHAEALAELRKHSGTQFHPACVEALAAALDGRDDDHQPLVVEEHLFAVTPPTAGPGSAGLGDLEPAIASGPSPA